MTGDVQNTRLFVDGVLLQGLNMILTLATYTFFMWRIHPGLTLACLSVSLPLWGVAHYYSSRLRPGYLRNRELSDEMVLLFSESVRGMQTVKGFAAEAEQIRRFAAANDQVSSQQRRIFWDLSIFTPGTQLLSQLSLVILFAYGGWLYVQGQIALGSGLVVFAGLLQQFTGQVANISAIANSVQQSLAAARRVYEVLDTPVEVQSRPDALSPGRLTGANHPGKCDVRLLAGQVGAGGDFLFGEAGADRGHFWQDGHGQKHAAGADPPVLRSAAGPGYGGWPRFAGAGFGRVPAADRDCVPGKLSVFQHGGGQHCVRASAGDAGTDRERGADCGGA